MRPHVYSPKPKQATSDSIEHDVARWTQASSAGSDLGRSDQTSARAYGRTLQEARQVAREALGNGLPEQEVQADAAVSGYVSSLLLAVDRPSVAEDGLSSSQLAGNSGARHIASFGWLDALVTAEQTVAAPDSVFELASVLIAWALAKMRLAAAAVEGGAAGEGPLKVSCTYVEQRQYAMSSLLMLLTMGFCRHTSLCRQLPGYLSMSGSSAAASCPAPPPHQTAIHRYDTACIWWPVQAPAGH